MLSLYLLCSVWCLAVISYSEILTECTSAWMDSWESGVLGLRSMVSGCLGPGNRGSYKRLLKL